jgi:hypothetical protein
VGEFFGKLEKDDKGNLCAPIKECRELLEEDSAWIGKRCSLCLIHNKSDDTFKSVINIEFGG